ncbi:DUF2155 domain-containing protein [Parvularcula dongshanensis]|uniref:DUF2155 domain-containing protein n=1 Tax=Parvularcula dongshanensis TaxID=1173995 RepID=A0A840I168_9PROT|nr:DUF2155 domain-containing protein [Parvularcula dongshanensis]MBB4658487.1 hypothetical protein [Parvularcula dongshanensis]
MTTSLRAGLIAVLSAVPSMALAQAGPPVQALRPDAAEANEPLGWTTTPEIAEEDGTELDRLSRSPSGIAFGAELLRRQSDNPLKPVSVTLRALDKVTAAYRDLEVPIGEEMSFGTLTLLPRTCDKRPPEEFPETSVFLEVFASDADVHGRRTRAAQREEKAAARRAARPGAEEARPALFRGWMFASTPSLNALEHPVYDVWVIDCKMVDPET